MISKAVVSAERVILPRIVLSWHINCRNSIRPRPTHPRIMLYSPRCDVP